ncbi:MAG: hypothetical protein IPI73_10675 [Betaproteobacteria bacterium]|nr:hypothetical protein [Betaproteobacteria bacterium]
MNAYEVAAPPPVHWPVSVVVAPMTIGFGAAFNVQPLGATAVTTTTCTAADGAWPPALLARTTYVCVPTVGGVTLSVLPAPVCSGLRLASRKV